MDEALISNYNKVVGPYDYSYILGDISYRTPQQTVDIFKRMNGIKTIVKGNHDSREMVRALIESGVVSRVVDYWEMHDKPSGSKLVLMHYPLLTWRADRHGSIHLHGHCHGSIDDQNLDVLRMDVGVDTNKYAPISLTDILTIMTARKAALLTERNVLTTARDR